MYNEDSSRRTLKPSGSHFVNHGLCQNLRRHFVHVVCQSNGAAVVQTIPESLYAVLDCLGRVVGPVQCVDIGVDDLVSQFGHNGEGKSVRGEVRRSHIGRVVSDDLSQRRLQELHLTDDVVPSESGEVSVGPPVSISAVSVARHGP